jgi:uncharacterized membrane protein
MSETAFVNLFIVLRILLVGGIFLALPLISRKGLLFGAYVGEEVADQDAARDVLRQWYRNCALMMALALLVGFSISFAGAPLAGNYASAATLLLGYGALYLRSYYAARKLIPQAVSRQADVAVTTLDTREPDGFRLAQFALAVCVLVSLGTAIYAMVGYDAMPDRVPVVFGSSAGADETTDKSVVTLMFWPSLNLVVSPFVALLAVLTARAKRSIRGGTGGHSVEAQVAFRATMANLFSGTALFTCAILTVLSVQIVRVGLSQTDSVGIGFAVLSGAMLLFMLVSMFRIMIKYGQGGALIEQGSVAAPLTNGIADNEHWVWGAFYVNRNDPSIMVEKRFGLGYTMNLGNPRAVMIVVTFLALLITLTTVGLIEMLS